MQLAQTDGARVINHEHHNYDIPPGNISQMLHGQD